ncbi:hypothetical protein Lser_V15G08996 [Lactuca serriola]
MEFHLLLGFYNMSNIAKLEFAALKVSRKNYVPWMIDVKMHLKSMGISNAIYEFNNCLAQDKAKAQVFLRKHIDEMLRFEYLDVTDPSILWNLLKERFDHQKEVILPNAIDEWRTLRFQHLKKQNNELLMKNHESCPMGSVALPEANATNTDGHRNNTRGRGRGHGRGRGRDVVEQAIRQGPVAYLHILVNFINSPLKEKKKETNLVDKVEFTPLTFDDFRNDMEDIN